MLYTFWYLKKRPRYIKFHRDIELIYDTDRWIVRDNKGGFYNDASK